MNTHDHEFSSENEEFISRLSRLAPAQPKLDAHTVFYQAGFAAAEARQQLRLRRMSSFAVVASLIGMCTVGTLAYRAGSTATVSAVAAHTNDEQQSSPSISEPPAAHFVKQSHDRAVVASHNSASNEPVASITWWSLWLPPDSQPTGRRRDVLLENGGPMTLIGLHVPHALPRASESAEPSAPHAIAPPDPLHPRDWEAVLPLL